jgi:hypothetical protein
VAVGGRCQQRWEGRLSWLAPHGSGQSCWSMCDPQQVADSRGECLVVAVNQAIADMICLAFFFLLRPGEYTGTSSETQPFTFQDISFYLGDLRLDKATAIVEQLLAATRDIRYYGIHHTEKQCLGKIIGPGRSGNPHFCPVSAAAHRIIHLRQAQAPLTQPLASYLNPQTDRLRLAPYRSQ